MPLFHPVDDEYSTAGIKWAEAFLAAYPHTGLHPLGVGLWFHNAIEAGYLASEHGRPLHEDTEPPAA